MQIIANGLQIEVDDPGPAEQGEPILLIMGLGMQLIGWPDELVQMLVQRGFRVIRHRQPRRRPEPGLRPARRAQRGWSRRCATRCSCACARPTRWPTWRPMRWACSTRWASRMRTSAARRWAA